MPGFAIENFGCRAARADGEDAARHLEALGFTEQPLASASVVIVNTCTVTAQADRDARAFLRRIRRRNPEARILVTGCYAQRAPEEVAALDGVTAVVGNSHKALLPSVAARLVANPDPAAMPNTDAPAYTGAAPVPAAMPGTASPLLPPARLLGSAAIWADDAFAHSTIGSSGLSHWSQAHPQTRPNLKIQEGCNNRCSFCVIPFTRGASRSMPPERVLAEVGAFVAAGGRELVLSGINLGRWGRDLPSPATLASLLRQILHQTPLERLRLSSIEPMDWTPELIALLADPRIASHAHLPLQSGSDAVLRRMHRRYRPWHYADRVRALVAACGDSLALGADVMVGFPGESDDEFAETREFLESQPFTYLHLFPFSPRPSTPAAALHAAAAVPPAVVAHRMDKLRQLARRKNAAFRQRMQGRQLAAITLHTPPELRAQAGVKRSAEANVQTGIQTGNPAGTLALTENFLEYILDAELDSNRSILLQPVSATTATLVKSQGNPAP